LTAAGGGQIFDPRGERVLGLAQTAAADRLIPDQTGFYEIRGNDGVRWIAVNVDARESDLTPLPASFVQRWRAMQVRQAVATKVGATAAVHRRTKAAFARTRSALARRAVAAGRAVAGESLPRDSPGDTEMSARERLESYLDSLRARLRAHIYARAAAIALAGILAITAFTVWTLQRQEFAPAIAVRDASRSSCCSRVSLRCWCGGRCVGCIATRVRTFSSSDCRTRTAASRPISTASGVSRRALPRRC
jgi:hypothetical protein